MADIIMTITFLGYWFLVVQPHQMVPSLDKLVDKMVSEGILIFANADQPAVFGVSAAIFGIDSF